jgi:hypothetical protein
MVQFLSIKFFCWISTIFVGFFKGSRFFCHPVYLRPDTVYISPYNLLPQHFNLILKTSNQLIPSFVVITSPSREWINNSARDPTRDPRVPQTRLRHSRKQQSTNRIKVGSSVPQAAAWFHFDSSVGNYSNHSTGRVTVSLLGAVLTVIQKIWRAFL